MPLDLAIDQGPVQYGRNTGMDGDTLRSADERFRQRRTAAPVETNRGTALGSRIPGTDTLPV